MNIMDAEIWGRGFKLLMLLLSIYLFISCRTFFMEGWGLVSGPYNIPNLSYLNEPIRLFQFIVALAIHLLAYFRYSRRVHRTVSTCFHKLILLQNLINFPNLGLRGPPEMGKFDENCVQSASRQTSRDVINTTSREVINAASRDETKRKRCVSREPQETPSKGRLAHGTPLSLRMDGVKRRKGESSDRYIPSRSSTGSLGYIASCILVA